MRLATLLLGFLLCAAAARADDTSAGSDARLVYTVDTVVFEPYPTNAPVGRLTVTGTTRQGGWRDIHLVQINKDELEPSEMKFRVVGTPPSGPATDALMPFDIFIEIGSFRYAMTKIRVIAETNEMTVDITR